LAVAAEVLLDESDEVETSARAGDFQYLALDVHRLLPPALFGQGHCEGFVILTRWLALDEASRKSQAFAAVAGSLDRGGGQDADQALL
jgi:hypothetical protein